MSGGWIQVQWADGNEDRSNVLKHSWEERMPLWRLRGLVLACWAEGKWAELVEPMHEGTRPEGAPEEVEPRRRLARRSFHLKPAQCSGQFAERNGGSPVPSSQPEVPPKSTLCAENFITTSKRTRAAAAWALVKKMSYRTPEVPPMECRTELATAPAVAEGSVCVKMGVAGAGIGSESGRDGCAGRASRFFSGSGGEEPAVETPTRG